MTAVSYTHLESTQYGKQDYTVAPIEGLELADQLHDAVKYIREMCIRDSQLFMERIFVEAGGLSHHRRPPLQISVP